MSFNIKEIMCQQELEMKLWGSHNRGCTKNALTCLISPFGGAGIEVYRLLWNLPGDDEGHANLTNGLRGLLNSCHVSLALTTIDWLRVRCTHLKRVISC